MGNTAPSVEVEDSSYVLLDSDGACIVAEPGTYTRISTMAESGRLEVRLGLLDGVEVALLGDGGRPRCALKVRMLDAHGWEPAPRLRPLFVGAYLGGAFVRRELGLLEFAPNEASSSGPLPNQPGLGLTSPIEDAWIAARTRYLVVGAPF